MREYPFQLVNVFAESHFGGNPLAVFPDAAGLSDGDMLQIARQFNLSETVFAFGGSAGAAADLRISRPVANCRWPAIPRWARRLCCNNSAGYLKILC